MTPIKTISEAALQPHALKDMRLFYRGCSSEFALCLGQSSAAQVVGRSDDDLLSPRIAAERTKDERLVLRYMLPSLTAAEEQSGPFGWLLRLPLLSEQRAQGIDLMALQEDSVAAQVWHHFFPDRAQEPCGDGFGLFLPESTLWWAGPQPEREQLQSLCPQILKQLSPAAVEWLAQGRSLGDAVRCGELQFEGSDSCIDISWALMLWGGQPALALSMHSELISIADPQPASAEHTVQQQDYRALIDASANGVLILDRSAVALANASAAQILGFDDSEQLQQFVDIESLLPEELRVLLLANGATEVPRLQQYETIWRSRMGASLYLISHWQQIIWQGRPCHYVCLININHRYHSELKQLRNQQRFRDFAELAADFFWELDENLRFSFVSHRFESVLQIAPKNVLGLSIRQFYERYFPQPAPPQWRRHLQSLAAQEPQRDFEYRWTRADGKERVIVHTCQPIFDEQGVFEGYRGVGRDVSHDRALAAQVQFHATHDALTGLVNRREFERLMEEALHDADSAQQQHVLCYVDLDNFKIVNDSCGHSAGDELLRQLGDLFREQIRQSDVVARLGGDEFGILIYSCGVEQALELAEKIRSSVEEFQFLWEKQRFSIGASMGLAPIIADSGSANEVMSAADAACYTSKERGRNQVTMAEDVGRQHRSDAQRVTQVGGMLEEGHFQLWRQPILAMSADAAPGEHFEILLRLLEPDGTLISPAAVMPTVERYGLCAKLDRAVFDRTLAWVMNAREQLDQLSMCSINLSGPSLLDQGLVEHIDRSIRRSGIPPHKFCFELSETAAIANLSGARAVVAKLGKSGCRFALDDFGSGMSSFTFLRDLPIDFVKIDGGFVTRLLEDPVCREMVNATHRVSKLLGSSTIAESVENAQTLDALQTMGVDYAQGFHIGSPKAIND